MIGKEKIKEAWKKWSALVWRYKYVLVVILAGLVLLLLPRSGGEADAGGLEAGGTADRTEFDLEAMERRLEDILSEIKGAGEVRVVLSVKGGSRQIIAQDVKRSERENSSSAVVISKGSGVEDTVLLQEVYPQYQGALVVCPGGDDPAVRLKLMEAVAAITGLGTDKISICKSK